MQNRPIAIELFSGAGGFALGLESCGFNVVAALDIDPIAAATYHYNFSLVSQTICRDIHDFTADQIDYKGDVDLITFGSPCQGFSLAGKKNPQDKRNQLSFEAARIIFEVRPKYFIAENVPAIAYKNNVHILHDLINLFEQNGYSVVEPWQILNAHDYGVAQSRKRLFLLGYRNDCVAPNYPQPIPESQRITVGDAIADLANTEPYLSNQDQGINKWILKNYGIFCKLTNLFPQQYRYCHIRNNDLGAIWGHTASEHNSAVRDRFRQTKPGEREPISKFYKLDYNQPCLTIRAGTNANRGFFMAARHVHYECDRCITPREAARLHSFPDWFNFPTAISHAFRQIGNSVCPLVAQALGHEIIECLGMESNQFEVISIPRQNPDLLNFSNFQAADFWGVDRNINGKRIVA